MLIADAEVLKKQLTDKYVVVNQSVPELRRFVGLTGRVKTVNMNCRALVEFDGPVDISWYDIDPAFLTVVDAPQPKEKAKPKKAAAAKTAEKKTPAKGANPLEMARKQGAAAAGSGEKKLSPLEMARQQGAAGNAPAAASAEKKLSPLELARQQGAAGGKSADSAPSPAPAPAATEKKLSPLELARQQGAVKSEAEAAAPVAEPASEEPEAAVAKEAPTQAASGSLETPSSTEGIIALARKQGAFQG